MDRHARRDLVDEGLGAVGQDLLHEDGGARYPDAADHIRLRDVAPGGALGAQGHSAAGEHAGQQRVQWR